MGCLGGKSVKITCARFTFLLGFGVNISHSIVRAIVPIYKSLCRFCVLDGISVRRKELEFMYQLLEIVCQS